MDRCTSIHHEIGTVFIRDDHTFTNTHLCTLLSRGGYTLSLWCTLLIPTGVFLYYIILSVCLESDISGITMVGM